MESEQKCSGTKTGKTLKGLQRTMKSLWRSWNLRTLLLTLMLTVNMNSMVPRSSDYQSNLTPEVESIIDAHYEELAMKELERKQLLLVEDEICNRINELDLSMFDSPDKRGSGKFMHPELLRKFVLLERKLGRELAVTSGYRTPKHNASLKKRGLKVASNSAHMDFKAIDIPVKNSKERYEILASALEIGFNRIGVADRFIHLDIDESKYGRVVWTY